ncbi:MAG: 4-hydroxythreonine-4-phosphate dehydrogenase PdxA [bacterium]|nr:4-hydroxythreonine-4-phosphate dehydrogenase PdxA [bacterium]
MGDPAGIGPEIIVKALQNSEIYDKCRPVVLGTQWVMEDAIRMTGSSLKIRGFENIADADPKHGVIDVYNMDNVNLDKIPYGQVDAVCGKASGQYIEKAIYMALDKEINAIVTAPINKESFDAGGYGKKYRGHTEMLRDLTNSGKAVMMLASGNLRVIHVTTHVPVRRMVDMITKERVYNTILQAAEGCRQLGIQNPRIGVCGLNPHAGEGGIMGHEEEAEIIPAIQQARADGLYIEGPYPSDTIYPRGTAGTLDIIVAMYHDQGHIPVKLMGFKFDGKTWHSVSGVNITIGLPIIRVSVDHGTAFGKAGKGTANETSIMDAIHYANLIAVNRDMA